ncbi:MAG: hypothetical protein NUW37_01830 [Planctomycetes bacterium]|nr:hypothetical protein [Planctomycetota bacterium]
MNFARHTVGLFLVFVTASLGCASNASLSGARSDIQPIQDSGGYIDLESSGSMEANGIVGTEDSVNSEARHLTSEYSGGADDYIDSPQYAGEMMGTEPGTGSFRRRECRGAGEIERELGSVHIAAFPLTIAVTQRGYRNRQITQEIVDPWEDKFIDEGVATSVQVIPDMLRTNDWNNLYDYRYAAARMHCDTVLVVETGNSCDEHANAAWPLYLTIVGFWIVPATTYESYSITQGGLFDTRNGAVIRISEGMAHIKAYRPYAIGDIDDVRGQSEDDSFNAMMHSLLERCLELKNEIEKKDEDEPAAEERTEQDSAEE